MAGRDLVIAAAKAALRRRLREARLAVAAAERAAVEAATAQALIDAVPLATPVAAYVAARGELDLTAFIAARWRAGASVLLPRVAGPGALTWHAVTAEAQLVAGAYGIRAPSADLPEQALPVGAQVIVPGLGFTAEGGRLGQGGGFYDRLLARGDLRTTGVGFACQLVDALPLEATDRPVAALLIAGRWLRAPAGQAGAPP